MVPSRPERYLKFRPAGSAPMAPGVPALLVVRGGGPPGPANPGPPGPGDWVQQRFRDTAAAVRVHKRRRGRRARRTSGVLQRARAAAALQLRQSRFCDTYDFFCRWDSRGPGPWCDLACYLAMLVAFDRGVLPVLRHLIVTGRLGPKLSVV